MKIEPQSFGVPSLLAIASRFRGLVPQVGEYFEKPPRWSGNLAFDGYPRPGELGDQSNIHDGIQIKTRITTWLVAELIRRALQDWPEPTSGIAALSFTRVGGDEIRKALGHELGHPHFVGTIDAFLFRYVLRPFLRRCFPNLADPRLVPGEWGAEHWSRHASKQSSTVGRGINLFGCIFIDELNGKIVIACKPHPARPLRPLGDAESAKVYAAKMRLWQRSGCLTHSDAALWASRILEHQPFGSLVRARSPDASRS